MDRIAKNKEKVPKESVPKAAASRSKPKATASTSSGAYVSSSDDDQNSVKDTGFSQPPKDIMFFNPPTSDFRMEICNQFGYSCSTLFVQSINNNLFVVGPDRNFAQPMQFRRDQSFSQMRDTDPDGNCGFRFVIIGVFTFHMPMQVIVLFFDRYGTKSCSHTG